MRRWQNSMKQKARLVRAWNLPALAGRGCQKRAFEMLFGQWSPEKSGNLGIEGMREVGR